MQTVSVGFHDGRIKTLSVPSDHMLAVDTCTGTLKFPNRSISSIHIDSNNSELKISLTSGEHWFASHQKKLISKLGVKNDFEVNEAGIISISFASPSAPEIDVSYFTKLLLKDGSVAIVSPSELLLPIITERGKEALPVGAVRALKFSSSEGEEQPDVALIRFPEGHLNRLTLSSSRHYFKVKDIYHNTLKLYYQDIKGILNAFAAPVNLPSSLKSPSYLLTLTDGPTRSIGMPLTLWKLNTDIGEIILPSYNVHSIQHTAKASKEFVLTTLYGEVFQGKLSPRSFGITSNDIESQKLIDQDDLVKLSSTGATLNIPEKCCVWYLKSGQAFLARLVDSSERFETDKLAGMSSLSQDAEDSFLLVSKNGTQEPFTPTSKRVRIILVSNGMEHSVRWKNIYRITSGSKISPSVIEEIQTLAQSGINKREAQSSDNDSTEAILKLSTAIGRLNLDRETIASITGHGSSLGSCVVTTTGDHFLVSTPSRKWFASLLNLDTFEFPEEIPFTIDIHPEQGEKAGPLSVLCRLISGDIIRGKLPPQKLQIDVEGRNDKVDLQTRQLKAIGRDIEGNLTFGLKRGTQLTGIPKTRKLEFCLLATGLTNSIPFRDIESLVVNAEMLPPPTQLRPEMPSELRGEIKIRGGSFQQGSSDGLDDELPEHAVIVDSYYMSATEVTKAQFSAFVNDSGYTTQAEEIGSSTTWKTPGFIQRVDDPAVCVSWNDAVAYCNWRSKQTDLTQCYTINGGIPEETNRDAAGYRLPTESEWEFAARNRGLDQRYPWKGTTLLPPMNLANYHQSSAEKDPWTWTNPVQEFAPNAQGLHGLGGNVWEWCEDWYFAQSYTAMQNRAPHNPCIGINDAANLTRKVMRGGSFKNGLDALRCASRGHGLPYAFNNRVGFRVVRNIEHP